MIIDKNDEKIINLLESDFPIKLIEVDFKDLTNKDFIIKSSFKESYDLLDRFDGKWFYAISLNLADNCIDILGLLNIDLKENYIILNWIEINKNFKKNNKSSEIIKYLKKWCNFRHFNGIIVPDVCLKNLSFVKFFEKFGFTKEEGKSVMEWKKYGVF